MYHYKLVCVLFSTLMYQIIFVEIRSYAASHDISFKGEAIITVSVKHDFYIFTGNTVTPEVSEGTPLDSHKGRVSCM